MQRWRAGPHREHECSDELDISSGRYFTKAEYDLAAAGPSSDGTCNDFPNQVWIGRDR
jgi:hypothetical protein